MSLAGRVESLAAKLRLFLSFPIHGDVFCSVAARFTFCFILVIIIAAVVSLMSTMPFASPHLSCSACPTQPDGDNQFPHYQPFHVSSYCRKMPHYCVQIGKCLLYTIILLTHHHHSSSSTLVMGMGDMESNSIHRVQSSGVSSHSHKDLGPLHQQQQNSQSELVSYNTGVIIPLPRKQRQLVKNNPGVLHAVAHGIEMAIHECRHQFADHQWNCPYDTSKKGKRIFGKIMNKGKASKWSPWK